MTDFTVIEDLTIEEDSAKEGEFMVDDVSRDSATIGEDFDEVNWGLWTSIEVITHEQVWYAFLLKASNSSLDLSNYSKIESDTRRYQKCLKAEVL